MKMPFEIEMAQTAVGILQNKDGKILIVKRRAKSKIDPGKWELPKGKVRKQKETPEEAIIREFKEETGIEVKVSRLLLTERISILGITIKMLIYEVKPLKQDFRVKLSDEHQDFRWIAPQDLDAYDFGLAMRGIIQSAFKKLGYPPDHGKDDALSCGKIPASILTTMISYMGAKQQGVLESPSIGRDCFVGIFEEGMTNALQFYEISEETCHFVVKADPITFPTPEPGKYAVIVNANDLATTGAVPYGMTLTMILPPGTKKRDLLSYQRQAHDMALQLNLMILGGHSEITESVVTPIISASMIGFVPPSKYINHPVEDGDVLFSLGYVGAEGTGIIAMELERMTQDERIQMLDDLNPSHSSSRSILQRAHVIGSKISITRALLQLNRRFMIKQAHDATEGGVFGATWELHQRLDIGLILNHHQLPLDESTRMLSKMLDFDPYRLISSGLALFITSREEATKIERLKEIDGLPIARVGAVQKDVNGVLIKETDETLSEPQPDDLIKALERIEQLRT